MNNDFARTPLFLFPWKHPSLSTKWVRQKYSIKTSGLNSSFIILGLICNCRFVFCHFEAEMRAAELLLLVIFLQSSLGFHHFDLSNSHENAGIRVTVWDAIFAQLDWLLTCVFFTCSLRSTKRASYFALMLCPKSHQSEIRPSVCCPRCHFMQKTLDYVFVLMPEATEQAGPAHWSPFHWWREGMSGEEEVKVTLSGKWWGSSGRELAERMKVKHWPAVLSHSRS